ncbi:MAG: AMP-binding protein [Pseudonocardia sp.]
MGGPRRHLATFLREDRGAGPGIEVRLAFEWSDWHHYPIAYTATLATGATVVTDRVDATQDSTGPRARASPVILRLPGEHGLAVVSDGDVVFREELPVPDWPDFAQPDADRPDAVAEVIHTSGTTGPRRAVACTYADIASILLRDAVAPMSMAVEPSILVHHVPLGSQAAQRILVESVRSHWQTSICVARPMGADLIRATAENHATFVGLVPTTARRVIHEAGRTGRVLPSVRWVTVGSEHVAPTIFEQLAPIFPGARLLATFGATEAGAARIRCDTENAPAPSADRSRDVGLRSATGRAESFP